MNAMNKNSAKITLNVIVKNEAPVIERMLKSVAPILDYYCIIDTGSTDGTQDIIRNFFEERQIPGRVVDHKWKNFEDARNTALKEGKKMLTEYGVEDGVLFWIDADEQLIVEPNFNLDKFKSNIKDFDGANVMVDYSGQNYYRMQFYNASSEWYWYGPVHEVLICDSPTRIAAIEGLRVLVTPDGNSWTAETQQQKYEGHAKILEEYVANDPKKDPRWLFYLAQSYRDASGEENLKKSLEWYEKRRDTEAGYWEERYYSALMAANIKSILKYPENEIIESFLLCGKYNPYRVEHLLPVMSYYQSKKEFDLAYIYGLRAVQTDGKLPMPDSTLFVDKDTYIWKIFDVHSLNCWYSGRKEEGSKWFKRLIKLMEKGKIPEQHHARIRENKKHFIGK